MKYALLLILCLAAHAEERRIYATRYYNSFHHRHEVLAKINPGDVISTGSPAGVGSARNPPIFMKAGDVASCTIEGIGTLTNPVAAALP